MQLAKRLANLSCTPTFGQADLLRETHRCTSRRGLTVAHSLAFADEGAIVPADVGGRPAPNTATLSREPVSATSARSRPSGK